METKTDEKTYNGLNIFSNLAGREAIKKEKFDLLALQPSVQIALYNS